MTMQLINQALKASSFSIWHPTINIMMGMAELSNKTCLERLLEKMRLI